MSVHSKMTAIANKIRTLLGISGAMGLDAMSANLGTAVNECDTQAELISQIKTALAGKTAGGGGGVQLPALTNPGTSEDLAEGKQLIDADGNVVTGTAVLGAEVKTATARPTSNSTTISFTGLNTQPKMFAICPTGNLTFNAQNRFVVNVMYDGTTTRGIYAVGSGSWNASYTGTHSATYFTWEYNNGTLTVRTSSNTNGGYFASGVTYQLTYAV